jgi:hypothetical protein
MKIFDFLYENRIKKSNYLVNYIILKIIKNYLILTSLKRLSRKL